MTFWNALLGGKQGWRLNSYERRLKQINRLEPTLAGLTNQGIKARIMALRTRARAGTPLEDLLVEAFALGREAALAQLRQQ